MLDLLLIQTLQAIKSNYVDFGGCLGIIVIYYGEC